jgi:hypothetical protein
MHGVAALNWSEAVAENAYGYIKDKTRMKHSDSYSIKPPAGPAAENMYWCNLQYRPLAAVVLAWYIEVYDCHGGPQGFTDGCYNGTNTSLIATTWHFTAMVWSTVKYMGCAWSDNGQIAICRYKAGDTLGHDVPNVVPEWNFVSHVPHMIRTEEECENAVGTGRKMVTQENSGFCRCGNSGWQPAPCFCNTDDANPR